MPAADRSISVDGSRTPFLKARGRPGPFRAADLAYRPARRSCCAAALSPAGAGRGDPRLHHPRPRRGQHRPAGGARLGCGERVPAWTVQRNCASGMQAIDSAATAIACGRADLVLAGGTEAMSHAPVLLPPQAVELLGAWQQARGSRGAAAAAGPHPSGPFQAGLRPAPGADRPGRQPLHGADRRDPGPALRHQPRGRWTPLPARATGGWPVPRTRAGWGRSSRCMPRTARSTTMTTGSAATATWTRLAKLKPAFDRRFGLVTAGNSAQVSDGAALLILASRRRGPTASTAGAGAGSSTAPGPVWSRPRWAWARCMPWPPCCCARDLQQRRHRFLGDQRGLCRPGAGLPGRLAERRVLPATELGLERAFGAIDPQRLNVDGGAVSLGHPVGDQRRPHRPAPAAGPEAHTASCQR